MQQQSKKVSKTDAPTESFLRALAMLPVDHTPVWFMRQAGRYMHEYRALRSKYSMLDLIRSPELASEVTMQPIDAFPLDAAIIFSDILPPLMGMGFSLDFVEGKGPVIANPIQTTRDVDMLATPPAREHLLYTLDAISLTREKLSKRGIPLIGFAGAPFTLASYAIEGGSSRTFAKTKAFMYQEPAAWKRLMTKLVTVQADYLLEQAKSGADALQVFDSWVGSALGLDDYLTYVEPYNIQLYAQLATAGVPVINFSQGVSAYFREATKGKGDAVSVDWRMPLQWYWEQLNYERPIQGNLDPVLLLGPWSELQYRIDQLLESVGSRPGHIFNFGHGILPQTDRAQILRTVEYIHERSRILRAN